MMITAGIILLNVFISLTALYGSEKLYDRGMLRPYRTVRKNSWYELITSGFLHGSLTHLLVNMMVLFFFGSVMEGVLGNMQFIFLYFSALIVSAIPSLIKHKDNPNYATIGASGAVEAVLFSYIFVFPTEKIILLLLPIPIPAWFFGLAFIGYSIFESKRGGGNINHTAHITGAVWGILYMILFVPNSVDHILTIIGLM
jgi:membrane associated rhomboid family serine protease